MTNLQAIIVGIIQGLTEFLPVSSSGHLVLAQSLMGIDDPGLTFELLLHLGTLLSVLIYFRATLFRLTRAVFDSSMKKDRAMIGYLALATLPVGLVGLTLRKQVEGLGDNPSAVCVFLCITGLILFLPRLLAKRNDGEITLKSAILMGCGQACAVLPGISRSGSTIVAGMASGVKPARAAEFSFLLAIPAITGACAVEFLGNYQEIDPAKLFGPYLAGAIAAFIFGLIAVYAVLEMIRRGKFEYFAYYCLTVGITGLIYFQFIRS
ncbi:MAG: undecaprenyl-diphosphatase [Pseudoalteromonas tetraodonis]|jgi:undecaprenyl-diphosphatase